MRGWPPAIECVRDAARRTLVEAHSAQSLRLLVCGIVWAVTRHTAEESRKS